MNQIQRIWKSLSNVQRVSLFLVPLFLSAIGVGGLRWKHDADFRTLYSSLTPEDASAVTQKIKEAGIEYRLDETGATVTVPADRLAEARLALAGAGMPRSGRIGFELFDRTNLGASDFTEQVNYQRALEGELERTVATLAEVEQARIHITAGKESVFLDSRQPAKATVVIKLRNQARIQQSSVTAIANLVASAVDGLSPEAVSIIDDSGRLLNRPRASDGDAKAAEVNLDYRQQLEAELQAKLNGALEPLLGAGKFRTGVNIDCDFTSVDQSDEIYDSTNAAMLTSQVTEESTGAGVAAGGQPGTASNLPSPPPKPTAGAAGVVRRTENNSYQPSRTVRHTVNPKGTIRKISTIVLLDHAVRWEGTGAKAKKIVVPPSAEVVKAVHDVVAGIVAFNEPRGDQITVESLPFESTLDAEPPMSATPLNQRAPAADKKQQMVLLGGGALVVAILLGGALFVMRRSTKSKVSDTAPAAIAGDPHAGGSQAGGLPASPGHPDGEIAKRIREGEQEQARLEAEVLSAIKLPAATKATEVLIRHIRESTHKDPATAANVLRAWMNDTAGKTS
jgi:flagellar M-ring protein FliF